MRGRSMRGICPHCSLNHSSPISGIPGKLEWESQTEFPMVCVENEGSAYTTIRSLYRSGGEDSRTPNARTSWVKSTKPDCEMARLPELVNRRSAYAIVVALVCGDGGAMRGVGAAATAVGGILYSSTVGTVSYALSLMRIGSSEQISMNWFPNWIMTSRTCSSVTSELHELSNGMRSEIETKPAGLAILRLAVISRATTLMS